MALSDTKIKDLEIKANEIRVSIIEMLLAAGSGHTAGPLGMADIFTYLYFYYLNIDPKDYSNINRDRLVLSNGHICPVLYSTLAHRGFFPVEELKTLRKFGSRLQGHPHRDFMPFVETSSGPLGSGVSQAVGMALAERVDKGRASDKQFVVLTGDGELDCGQIWEALMLAGKEKLQNLTMIVDRNNIQIDGFTEDIMPLEPLADKFRAFGFSVHECDGHNFTEIDRAFGEARAVFEKPSVIIAHTIPSKGVPEFERMYEWHGKPPNKEEAEIALKDLRSLFNKIKVE